MIQRDLNTSCNNCFDDLKKTVYISGGWGGGGGGGLSAYPAGFFPSVISSFLPKIEGGDEVVLRTPLDPSLLYFRSMYS